MPRKEINIKQSTDDEEKNIDKGPEEEENEPPVEDKEENPESDRGEPEDSQEKKEEEENEEDEKSSKKDVKKPPEEEIEGDKEASEKDVKKPPEEETEGDEKASEKDVKKPPEEETEGDEKASEKDVKKPPEEETEGDEKASEKDVKKPPEEETEGDKKSNPDDKTKKPSLLSGFKAPKAHEIKCTWLLYLLHFIFDLILFILAGSLIITGFSLLVMRNIFVGLFMLEIVKKAGIRMVVEDNFVELGVSVMGQIPREIGISALVIGFAIMFSLLLAFIGIIKRNKCLLALHITALLTMIIFVTIITFEYCFNGSELKVIFDKTVNNSFYQHYRMSGNTMRENIDHHYSYFWDSTQQRWQCCGSSNYTDFLRLPSYDASLSYQVPWSCCKNITVDCRQNPKLSDSYIDKSCTSELWLDIGVIFNKIVYVILGLDSLLIIDLVIDIFLMIVIGNDPNMVIVEKLKDFKGFASLNKDVKNKIDNKTDKLGKQKEQKGKEDDDDEKENGNNEKSTENEPSKDSSEKDGENDKDEKAEENEKLLKDNAKEEKPNDSVEKPDENDEKDYDEANEKDPNIIV